MKDKEPTKNRKIFTTLECNLTVHGMIWNEATIDENVYGTYRVFIDGKETYSEKGVFKIKGILSNE